jgi:hypothetical protein
MVDLFFAAILIGELVGFYYFYRTEYGCKAIYITWFAWIIDALGIISGTIIMGVAVFIAHHQKLFEINIPFAFILLLFIQGSWQASIHAVKWIVRSRL